MMSPAVIVLFCAALLVTADSKSDSTLIEEASLDGPSPRRGPLNVSDTDTRSAQSSPSSIPSPDEGDSASSFLHPRFVVPDNGEPVGLRVKPGAIASVDGYKERPVLTAESRSDKPGDVSLSKPSAASRTDLYGLISGQEATDSLTSSLASPTAQRRNEGTSFPAPAGDSVSADPRGRLLSLIDDVYQQNLDRDNKTTFITPLDRVSGDPFELSVSRYSRFVESQAQRSGRQHTDEDLDDFLQRLKGRLDLEEPDNGQTEEPEIITEGDEEVHVVVATGEGSTVRDYVDQELTAPLIVHGVQGGKQASPENADIDQFYDTYGDDDDFDTYADGYEEVNAENREDVRNQQELKVDYEYDNDATDDDKVGKQVYEKLENEAVGNANEFTTRNSEAIDSKAVNISERLEKLAQLTSGSPSSGHLSEEKPCQGDCDSANLAIAQSRAEEKRKNDFDVNKAGSVSTSKEFSYVAEPSGTLQPPVEHPEPTVSSYVEVEANSTPASVHSGNDHGDPASLELHSNANERKQFESNPPSNDEDDNKNHLPEYETHAEISLRGSIASSDPAAEGYGPAKPSSIYVPVEETQEVNANESEEYDPENAPERAVTPRSFDEEEPAPPSSSQNDVDRASPRLIEPWEPPKQQPRIRIHLPFVQKETVVQFHPPDRDEYGPPKGFVPKPADIGEHRTRGNPHGKTVPSSHRPPSPVTSDGHIVASSEIPSHLLPKEHRAEGQKHAQVPHANRLRPGKGRKPSKHPGRETNRHRPHSAGHTTPKTHHTPTTAHPKPSLRPAWLDVPREVLPLAEPGTMSELPRDPLSQVSFDLVRVTTPSPAYFPIFPHTESHSTAPDDEEKSSYSTIEPLPTPHGPTVTTLAGNYVSPIPVRLKPTTPSSYTSLPPNPLYVSYKPEHSFLPPKPTPSYITPELSSHASPEPTQQYTTPKPISSYSSPSHSLPPTPTKPTLSYVHPEPSPSYATPTHPVVEPHAVSLPLAEVRHPLPEYQSPQHPVIPPSDAIRNYVVKSVDDLAERPLPRIPAGSHITSYEEPSHGGPLHPTPFPDVHLPLPRPVEHPVRNYVSSTDDKLVQKSPSPVVHSSSPGTTGHSIRNYVAPPKHKLAQKHPVPKVHPPVVHAVELPVRNYAATTENQPVRIPQPAVALPHHQPQTSHITRNYHPAPVRRDGADHGVAEQDVGEHFVVVKTPESSAEDRGGDEQLLSPADPPAAPEHQRTLNIDHESQHHHQQQEQQQEEQQQQHEQHQHRNQQEVEDQQQKHHEQQRQQQQQQRQESEQQQQQQQQHQQQEQEYQEHEQEHQRHQQEHEQQLNDEENSRQQRQQLTDEEDSRQQLPDASSTADYGPPKLQQRQETSIIDILEAADSKLLLKLMDLSGMRQLLEDTGPYTLFAPSERALEDLLTRLGGLDTILDSMGKKSLLKLLQYHVLRGYALLEDLDHDLMAKTLEGSRLRINRYDTYDNVYGRANVTTANGERLVQADLAADNGLVHFIDGVLAPPPADLMQSLQRDPRGRFTVLTEAVRLAGLQELLSDDAEGPLTLLAPTNTAFTQLPAEQLRRLLRDRHRLRQLLLGHVLPGTLYSAGLQPFQEEQTLAGSTVRVFSDTVSMKVDNALVLVPDVTAGNGVVHAIDAVLGLPSER